MSRMRL